MPHGYCIKWSESLVYSYVISDMLIFLAYFSMPVALVYFGRRRHDFPYPGLLKLFSAFIMACGLTHLMGVVLLWVPVYQLDALLKIVTACISVITAVFLWPIIPHALKLPSPKALQILNEALQDEIAKHGEAEAAKELAEENLLNEQTIRAAIVEYSAEAIISKSTEGIISSWNHAAEKLFGYSAPEIIGKSVFILIPEDRREEEQQIMSALKRGEAIWDRKTQRLCKDGSRVWVSVTNSPMFDRTGAIIGASKFVRDITELRRAEEEIKQLNADLERRVVERTQELSAANSELDSFAYAVSHDLRAPLRAMSGFSQALVEDYGELLQGEASVYLQQIEIASQKMSALIDSILLLSRSSRVDMHAVKVDISRLAGQLLAEMANSEPDRHVQTQIEEGLQLFGDERMIEVVMRNLLENAWKYTNKTAAASIRVYSEIAEGRQFICIADNGAGFDMAHANRLFQPFQRLHRHDEFVGMGIGLATVRRIINRHGGDISAQGEPGKGAVFRFYLSKNTQLTTETGKHDGR